jgi:DNA-3-methyladenine glycosylase II
MNQFVIKKSLDELAAKDPDVQRRLVFVGYPEIRIRPTGFGGQLGIILGQQISTGAASSIRKRLNDLWEEKNQSIFS